MLAAHLFPLQLITSRSHSLLDSFALPYSTKAESVLCQTLRSKQLEGLKFKWQVPLDGYIFDFGCFKARLIVEVDGGQHAESARDAVRDRHFEAAGFRVLRCWNDEVLKNIDGVCLAILQEARGRQGEG